MIEKQNRVLEIFYRLIKGEQFTLSSLANKFEVSTKSIARDISDIRSFLSDNGELLSYNDVVYKNKSYKLSDTEFLSPQEIFCILKIILNSKALKPKEIKSIFNKFINYVAPEDRERLSLITKSELINYTAVNHDNKELFEMLWIIINSIHSANEITIDYIKMDRSRVTRTLKPVTITFSEFYFYLIAYDGDILKFFRVDRIKHITKNNTKFKIDKVDVSNIKKRTFFMHSGELMTIRFEFSGPSIQAILDKLETARIIESKDNIYTIECESYGSGIKMFLLSQGYHVKVLSPPSFVKEMREEALKLYENYK